MSPVPLTTFWYLESRYNGLGDGKLSYYNQLTDQETHRQRSVHFVSIIIIEEIRQRHS